MQGGQGSFLRFLASQLTRNSQGSEPSPTNTASRGDSPRAENSGASRLGQLSLLLAALSHFLISSSLPPTVLLLPK